MHQLREVLKIFSTDIEKTIIDTANSIIEHGMVKTHSCFKKQKPKLDAEEGNKSLKV